ncbi:hypothetical protein [Eleftheria terrae]|uniref:hypothetical protein n=1 Tax=Eleftheria terrae TaxID=1597781 RepID=UPI00263B2D2C|nr:hypothetical protein [Eleftheria terrae]WKB55307.1 hypothetical protein N7L95_24795 [Eleftheria terrae]
MHKLSQLSGGEWVAHSFPPVYRTWSTDAGGQALVAGIPAGDPQVFERLVMSLEPPCFLLYVLHTPRGEAPAGRYQSTQLSLQQVQEFIRRFGGLLSQDARFDLWAHSPADQATLVWDRHNQLFGYGPVERFVAELRRLGFQPGECALPVPHRHHYRKECDAQAVELLASLDWTCSPLQPEDEQ